MTFAFWGRGLFAVTMATLLLVAAAQPSRAEDEDIETRTKRARSGGGLRFGTWDVQGLETPAGGSSSEGFAFEGYFQKGLDLHLAWESTLGFWQRSQSLTEPGPVSGETTYEARSYVVPTTTALKIYPTRPSAVIEPYLMGGLGVVLALDRQTASSTDPVGPSADDTGLHTGLALKAGVGLDLKPTRVLGLTAGGSYQWVGFGEDVGGERTYKGLGFHAGLTYRFQYQ